MSEEIIKKLNSYEKKVLLIKMKIVSENIISIFSKHKFTCFGFLYKNPITHEENIIVVNILGLIIPWLSYIPLYKFLESAVEEIQLYEINTREYIKINNEILQCENQYADKWVKLFIQKNWLPKYREKNIFFKINKIIEEKVCVPLFSYDSSINSTRPHKNTATKNTNEATNKNVTTKKSNEANNKNTATENTNEATKDTNQTINGEEDEKLLKEVWPYISKLLLTSEYRFSSLANINEENLIHSFVNSFYTSKLNYRELQALKPYRSILPKLEKNKIIILESIPCKSLEEIENQFEMLVKNVKDNIIQEKPVEIFFNQWIDSVNDLFKASGKKAIDKIENPNIVGNLIFEKDKELNIALSNQKTYRVYNNQTDIPTLEPNDKEELLFFINAISFPNTPYTHIQSSLLYNLSSL